MFNKKEWMKEYRKDNKRIKKYNEQWRKDNPKYYKEYSEQWFKNHPEYTQQYYINNKEKINQQTEQWNKNNCERHKEYMRHWRENYPEYDKQWHGTPEGKLSRQKGNFKHRQLGFISLNKFFVGSEAHHISKNFVIYIPKKLHKSIWHSIWTWQNMDKINKLAMGYLN